MGGAQPLYLTVAFILEEGCSWRRYAAVVIRWQGGARGRPDRHRRYKVVEKGSETASSSTPPALPGAGGVELSASAARPGDCVLLSGSIGEHGMAILSEREGLEFEPRWRAIPPRCTRWWPPCSRPTAGFTRCATPRAAAGLQLAERNRQAIRLGIDRGGRHPGSRSGARRLRAAGSGPAVLANEGKLIAMVDDAAADAVLAAMRSHPWAANACAIGRVTAGTRGMVTMRNLWAPADSGHAIGRPVATHLLRKLRGDAPGRPICGSIGN